MPSPLVSIVVSTRNRADLLPRALASIAGQSFENFECIVVDDGSSQETVDAYLQTLTELGPRFRLDRAFPPGSAGTGPASTKNRGLRAAGGRYVAFLDDDDWWVAADHLSVAIESLQRYEADYFFSNRQGVKDGTVVIGDWYRNAPKLMSGPRLGINPNIFQVSVRDFCDSMQRARAPHPGNLVTTRALALDGGGFMDRLFWGEDFEFCVRVADGASKILYRQDVTTAARLPEGDSVSLSESVLRQHFEVLAAMQHLRARCRQPEFRACARAREAWTLRELALGDGPGTGLYHASVAWQAWCTCPTLGSALLLLRCLGRTLAPGKAPGAARPDP